jgi:ABC-type Na+ efflux pump permease subunit
VKGSKTLRITRWEVTGRTGALDRRAALALVVAVLTVGLVGAAVAAQGTAVDRGTYRVGVAGDSPFYEPVASDPTFAAVEPDRDALADGRLEVLIDGDRVLTADTPKGRAALAELRTAVEGYNDRTMAAEDDRAAAFPVVVELVYERQDATLVVDTGQSAGDDADGTAGESDGEESTDDREGADGVAEAESDGDGGLVPSFFGGPALLAESGGAGTPSDVAPPFPFGSLVLAFAFLVPMNFVVQAYASSVLAERIGRRGELLLVAPVSRWSIIAGKTLPYFLGMVAIAALTALAIGAGAVAVAAVVPIALTFLACAFVAAVFARSFKELTFLTVAISVGVTSYVFVPAIFTDVHPIAIISPLTLVVFDLQGEAVRLADYVFSTGPFYLAAGVLFALGAGVYREEDLFTQRPVHLKAADALAGRIRGRASAAKLSALSIPFVFAAELAALAVLFALPSNVSVPVLLVIVAFVEEVAKSLHVHAGFLLGRYDRSYGTALAVGALSGLGFFLAEKLVVVAQLVGLPELELGRAAFGLAIGAGAASPLTIVALLLAPLVLHVVTASISALGARRSGTGYATGLVVATLVHAGYNLAVVSALV